LPPTPSSSHWVTHALPTRRSSDLGGATQPQPDEHAQLVRADRPATDSIQAWQQRIICTLAITSTSSASTSPTSPWTSSTSIRRRSEEHTSELQSRFDLVCRLLLEH